MVFGVWGAPPLAILVFSVWYLVFGVSCLGRCAFGRFLCLVFRVSCLGRFAFGRFGVSFLVIGV